MSQKNNSLAVDEMFFEELLQPRLNLIVNLRHEMNEEFTSEPAAEIEPVVSISGRITVSF